MDLVQTPQNVLHVSESTLYATHAALETSAGSEMDLSKFQEKYGKDLSCPIIRVNAVIIILYFFTLRMSRYSWNFERNSGSKGWRIVYLNTGFIWVKCLFIYLFIYIFTYLLIYMYLFIYLRLKWNLLLEEFK